MSAWHWPALSSSPIQQERGPGAARPPHRGLSWTLPHGRIPQSQPLTQAQASSALWQSPQEDHPTCVEQAGCPATREDQDRTQALYSPGEREPP